MFKHLFISYFEWKAAYFEAKGNYKRASQYLMKSAIAGSLMAANQLGIYYLQGRGIQSSATLAAKWFDSAARQGDPYGQANLASLWQEGFDGNCKDLELAHKLYLAAAQQGHAESQYNVALMYLQGEGVQCNEEEALHWLREAAAQDFDPANEILRKL